MATSAQLSEKARIEQDLPRAPSPSSLEPPRGRQPPLPPRESTAPGPPAYSTDDDRRSKLISEQWRSNDPRSSSTHSLVPSESGRNGRDGRRTLLLVFIHGFMGNETSFQSFPAHVHNLLTITLAETHVVHTKIYPRYKSRKAIDFARDDFSTWLAPHENRHTDVILLGHSMGGILSAEVALKPPPSPATGRPFNHHLLGTISFDTPFLGMHPGVISSGIGSLFRPAPEPPVSKQSQASTSGTNTPATGSQSTSSRNHLWSEDSETSSQLSMVQSITSPLSNPPSNDPFYNPPFPNDVRIAERKGWTNVLHFINKHADGNTAMMKINALTSATGSYFMSHLEFGGCLADYPGLKNRYEKLRSLEDVDELAGRNTPGYRPPKTRVRFVNYYTASTGRPKAPKSPKIPPVQVLDSTGQLKPIEVEMHDMNLSPGGNQSGASTPKISIEEMQNGVVKSHTLKFEDPANDSTSPVETQMQVLGENSGVHDEFQEPPEMRHIDSMPIADDDDSIPTPIANTPDPPEEPVAELKPTVTEPALPPIPPLPAEPEVIDLSIYTDKDERKIAEKEQKRVLKAFQQATKDRDNAIKDRKKLIEKREKKARQEQEKQTRAEDKKRLKELKEEEKRKATINPEPRERETSVASSVQDDKPKRDKKFCMLPPEYGGKRDKCWIRVYMEGVDEVGAHCGLFFPGPQYESLVGDIGERIGKWVEEAATMRAVLEAELWAEGRG